MAAKTKAELQAELDNLKTAAARVLAWWDDGEYSRTDQPVELLREAINNTPKERRS